jgi:hypothetical protein
MKTRPRETDSRFIETSLLTQVKDIRNGNLSHLQVPWLQYMYSRKFHNNLHSFVLDERMEANKKQKAGHKRISPFSGYNSV